MAQAVVDVMASLLDEAKGGLELVGGLLELNEVLGVGIILRLVLFLIDLRSYI